MRAGERPKSTARGPAGKPRGRGKPAYHHGDLRRALLEASVALIARDGVEALSLREVAREAGVSPAAPYHHFASKSELLGAIAGLGFAGLSQAMQRALAALPEPDEPIARLSALGVAYVEFARAHPTEFRLMFRPGLVSPADLPAAVDPADSFSLLLDAVARVAGVVPPELVTPEALALASWSLVHGAAVLLLDGPLANHQDSLPIAAEQVGPTAVGVLPALLRAVADRARAAQ